MWRVKATRWSKLRDNKIKQGAIVQIAGLSEGLLELDANKVGGNSKDNGRVIQKIRGLNIADN